MIFQYFCSLFVVTRYDVAGRLNLGPSKIGYHVHLVEHSTRVGVLLFAVLHCADESQPARNSCPRLLHSVDSRFGLYHVTVTVVLSFLRSPALHKFDSLLLPPGWHASPSQGTHHEVIRSMTTPPWMAC